MKIFKNQKNNTLTFNILFIITFTLLLIVCIFKFGTIIAAIGNILHILSPVIWGVAIAYLLSPIMMFFENLLKKAICKKKNHNKLVRGISVTIVSLLVILFITLFVYFVFPQLSDSINTIITQFDDWMANIKTWIYNVLYKYPQLERLITTDFDTISKFFDDLSNTITPKISEFLTGFANGIFSFIIGIKDFVLGFIISIYLLISKDRLFAQIKKTILAIFSKKKCQKIAKLYHMSDHFFIGFINGKILDSLIIGILAFISLTIMNFEFALILSIIIGITNIIPFFGPIIGAIPCSLLVLLSKPSQLLPFLIFILILQQFDGNILGPRILGDSTGLPAFWVMFAIFIGSGLFGFIGMVLCVPTFALIYALIREKVEEKLVEKHLPIETDCYIGNIAKFYTVQRDKDIKLESENVDLILTADSNSNNKK